MVGRACPSASELERRVAGDLDVEVARRSHQLRLAGDLATELDPEDSLDLAGVSLPAVDSKDPERTRRREPGVAAAAGQRSPWWRHQLWSPVAAGQPARARLQPCQGCLGANRVTCQGTLRHRRSRLPALDFRALAASGASTHVPESAVSSTSFLGELRLAASARPALGVHFAADTERRLSLYGRPRRSWPCTRTLVCRGGSPATHARRPGSSACAGSGRACDQPRDNGAEGRPAHG